MPTTSTAERTSARTSESERLPSGRTSEADRLPSGRTSELNRLTSERTSEPYQWSSFTISLSLSLSLSFLSPFSLLSLSFPFSPFSLLSLSIFSPFSPFSLLSLSILLHLATLIFCILSSERKVWFTGNWPSPVKQSHRLRARGLLREQ